MLSEINALRSADGAPGTTNYMGIVKVSYGSGYAGFGYIPGRAAVGVGQPAQRRSHRGP